jgi:TolA-binding protein
MLRVCALSLTMLVLLAAAGTMRAQQIHLPPSVSQGPGMGNVPVTSGDDVQKKQAAAANQQRQLEIRRDTEKMLELTSELREYLTRNDQTVMSLDAVKKAEQIEKLAHGVKAKMKQLY